MLLVEPEGVEIPVLADDLDQLRADQLAGPEDPDDLPIRQHRLDSRHPSTSFLSAVLAE
jgi:hypothetical protein